MSGWGCNESHPSVINGWSWRIQAEDTWLCLQSWITAQLWHVCLLLQVKNSTAGSWCRGFSECVWYAALSALLCSTEMARLAGLRQRLHTTGWNVWTAVTADLPAFIESSHPSPQNHLHYRGSYNRTGRGCVCVKEPSVSSREWNEHGRLNTWNWSWPNLSSAHWPIIAQLPKTTVTMAAVIVRDLSWDALRKRGPQVGLYYAAEGYIQNFFLFHMSWLCGPPEFHPHTCSFVWMRFREWDKINFLTSHTFTVLPVSPVFSAAAWLMCLKTGQNRSSQSFSYGAAEAGRPW